MKESEITLLLKNIKDGSKEAKDKLYNSIYHELKKTAKYVKKKWRGELTVNTTALVHEAYLKMVPEKMDWQSRLQFFYISGKIMRQILYNYTEKKMAIKRGGNKVAVDIEDVKDFVPLDEKSFLEIYCLENVLKNLEEHNEIYGKIIECRFYGGMTIEETAQVLKISEATVKRKWNFAKAWLLKEIKEAS